jgi:TRAP-type uncharacterized transport system fused permease subunit
MAGADPMRTAVNSVKTGWLAYIIPFAFVFSPGLTMNGSPGLITITVATFIVGIFLISIAMTGYFMRPIDPVARVVACLVGLILWIPVNAFAAAGIVVAGAAALGISLLAFEIISSKKSTAVSGDQGNA